MKKAYIYLVAFVASIFIIGLVFNYINVWLSILIILIAIYFVIRSVENFINKQ